MMDDMVASFDREDPEKILRAHKSPDKVSEFLADVRFFFRRRVEEKGKRLEVNFDEINPNWGFNIDRGMLHEIMENLIANALEHGGENIKIEVEKKPRKYWIHIMDDGKGISEKDRETIFRPFAKIALSTKANPKRGRGLAISQMLAEAHKGNLRLKRGPGKWSTDFILEIPER
jgi:two-component system sensor histidine kinase RstB